MHKSIGKLVSLGVVLVASLAATAEPTVLESARVPTSTVTVDSQPVADTLRFDIAKEMGLTRQEVLRYEAIMKGPKGALYRRGDANLFYVLGAESGSRAEELRYARMWVRAMEDYYSGLARMLSAYDAAASEFFEENEKIFLLDDASVAGQKLSSTFPSTKAVPPFVPRQVRTKLYVKATGCDDCVEAVETALSSLQALKISGVDIYVVDTGRNDAVIQRWAAKMRLPVALVNERLITLNHDDGKARGESYPEITQTYELPGAG